MGIQGTSRQLTFSTNARRFSNALHVRMAKKPPSKGSPAGQAPRQGPGRVRNRQRQAQAQQEHPISRERQFQALKQHLATDAILSQQKPDVIVAIRCAFVACFPRGCRGALQSLLKALHPSPSLHGETDHIQVKLPQPLTTRTRGKTRKITQTP